MGENSIPAYLYTQVFKDTFLYKTAAAEGHKLLTNKRKANSEATCLNRCETIENRSYITGIS